MLFGGHQTGFLDNIQYFYTRKSLERTAFWELDIFSVLASIACQDLFFLPRFGDILFAFIASNCLRQSVKKPVELNRKGIFLFFHSIFFHSFISFNTYSCSNLFPSSLQIFFFFFFPPSFPFQSFPFYWQIISSYPASHFFKSASFPFIFKCLLFLIKDFSWVKWTFASIVFYAQEFYEQNDWWQFSLILMHRLEFCKLNSIICSRLLRMYFQLKKDC